MRKERLRGWKTCPGMHSREQWRGSWKLSVKRGARARGAVLKAGGRG